LIFIHDSTIHQSLNQFQVRRSARTGQSCILAVTAACWNPSATFRLQRPRKLQPATRRPPQKPRRFKPKGRLKRRALDDFQAARLAELLGRAPMELIAAANAERAKDEEEKKYWLALAKSNAETATARKSGPLNLAPRPGLEPGTYGLTVRRSTD
jgi:hypothetical protein